MVFVMFVTCRHFDMVKHVFWKCLLLGIVGCSFKTIILFFGIRILGVLRYLVNAIIWFTHSSLGIWKCLSILLRSPSYISSVTLFLWMRFSLYPLLCVTWHDTSLIIGKRGIVDQRSSSFRFLAYSNFILALMAFWKRIQSPLYIPLLLETW